MARRLFPVLCGVVLFAIAWPVHGGTVSGRVLDEAGKPVAGAKLSWSPYRSDDEKLLDLTRGQEPAVSGALATDAEGRFRVTLDKPGALSSIRITTAGLSAFIEGPFDSTETTDLEDIQLPAAESVTGKITDESGKPVAGAKVRLGPLALFEEEVRFHGETVSGADGAFSMTAPEDARDLTARAAGFAPFRRARMDRKPGAEKVTLKRGGSVRVVVLDASGQPAAGVIVVSGEVAAETDAAGACTLAGVQPGNRSVEALWKEDFAARKDAVRVRKGEPVEVALKLVRAASITGTVIEEKTRRPIAGVSLNASSASGPMMRFTREFVAPVRRARTDPRGRFRIPGLLPQKYAVQAEREGFLPTSIPGVSAGTQSKSSIAIALTRSASVTGRVTTEDGKPVGGARIRIFRGDGPMAILNMRNPAASFFRQEGARTRPDGSFRLKQLAASRSVTLEAAKEGFAPVKKHGVALKAGETAGNVLFVLSKGLQARGRVVDSQGQPIAGAEVRIAPADRSGMVSFRIVSRAMRQEKPNAVSGRDGTFVATGLEEGEVVATVKREGFAEKSFSGLSVQSKDANEWSPFTLNPGVAITGVVRDAQGAPIVGASVGSFGETGVMRDVTTELDGSFRLDGYPADKPLMVNVRAEGYAWLQRNVTPPVENLVLVLKTAGTLRGRVEDAETKRPITDFSVNATPPRTGGFAMRMGGPNDRAFQSADGSFELSDVSPGRWIVRATAPGYRASEVGPVEMGEGETKEGLVVALKKGGTLSGRVLDPRRGTGVPNASVGWQAAAADSPNRMASMLVSRLTGEDTSTTTDADGRFSFDGLPDGKVVVSATHPDFLDVSKEVPTDAGSVDITLAVGGTISGSVVGRDGRTPLAGAAVSLNALGDTGMSPFGNEPVRADASGNFLFEHLRAGRYRVSADSPAGTAPSKEVVLTENQRLDGVLLTVAGGTLVRGTVSGLPQASLGGLRVWASARDYNDSAMTDEAGRFTLRDVPAGSLRIQASTAMMSGRTATKTFEVPEGAAELPVEIAFEGSSRLAGRITRAERPLSGVYVNANPDPPSATGGRASAQTDEDGRYALEGLTDGRYQVYVGGQGISYRKSFDVSGDTAGDMELPAVGVSGFVTDAATGDPIEGAGVRAETGRETAVYMMRQALTDSRGYYSLEDLDAGSYKITARKDGYQPKDQIVSVGASSSELNLALSRGAGLAIRATDGQTGLPLRGLTVNAFAGSTPAFTGSVALDSDGRGEISSLAPGTYTLHVFSQGYAPRTFASVPVPSGQLAVSLTPGGRVEVRSDAPVNARILDASGSTYMINPWRTDGRVNPAPPLTVWENFAPGSYQLIVSSPSGDKSYPFTVAEGRTTTVEVR